MDNQTETVKTVTIDVYADVACPWCYIGERRLEQALASRPNIKAEVRWQPFQLQPDMPKEGVPWPEFADTKFGGMSRAETMFARVAAAGADDNIEFRFDRIPYASNTSDSHRLILFARSYGREQEAVQALFSAYFTEGRNIGDREELGEIAAEIGLPAEETRAYLAGDANLREVEMSQKAAQHLGITGVPFFVVDGRYGLSGAQPLDVFQEVLDAVAPGAPVSI